MNHYFDTGVLLKLYVPEPRSPNVRRFVVAQGQPLPLLALHRAECVSALHLKAFRGECTIAQANRALQDLDEDLRTGVLRDLEPAWEPIWARTMELARTHSAATGCRTLDSLHVGAALELGFRRFVTSDARQASLAERAGLTVVDPTRE